MLLQVSYKWMIGCEREVPVFSGFACLDYLDAID